MKNKAVDLSEYFTQLRPYPALEVKIYLARSREDSSRVGRHLLRPSFEEILEAVESSEPGGTVWLHDDDTWGTRRKSA